MKLYLFRHAEAEPQGKKADANRQLTDAGKHDARKKSEKIKKKLSGVSLILSSPHARALQTAKILAEVLDKSDQLQVDETLVSGQAATAVLKLLKDLKPEGDTVIVGHEPTLSSLASLLISGSEKAMIRLKKGGLLALEVENYAPGGGVLISLR